MGPLATILASAGISIGGKIFGGMAAPAMPEMQWGAERARFASFLQQQLIPQREEAIGRFRLEAGRVDAPMGSAYLRGVSEIQQRMDEIFGREVSRFELEQAGARRGWEQQMGMLGYQRGQERQQRVESIFGTAAAIPGQLYGALQQEALTQAITSRLPTGQVQPATGRLDPIIGYAITQLAEAGNVNAIKEFLKRVTEGGIGLPHGPYSSEMIGAGY